MKVLVAPLDWGLGHATRCAPIIQAFIEKGCEVEVAVVKGNAQILREMFPNVRQRLCPSYNVVYPKHGYNMGFWLLKNSVHLNKVVRAERRFVEEMVRLHGYDIIVSDNRFAFYSNKAYSIYMTHQRRIAFPKAFRMFESIGKVWHATVMSRYDEIWVPDIPEKPGYAGSLSHTGICSRPLRFVGALSRFMLPMIGKKTKAAPKADVAKDLKIVAVISGVEPARSRFEAKLRYVLAQIPGKHVMILGKPTAGQKTWREGNITFYTHLPSDEFAQTVSRAEWVLSRGGYSTVMDMAVLGAKCIFVPTPGQYEQIILARELSAAGYAASISEDRLGVDIVMDMLSRENVEVLPKVADAELLCSAVSDVLRKV